MRLKTFFKIAAAMLAMATTNAAQAANWVEVIRTSNGTIYYHDTDSIRPLNGKIAVWEKEDAKDDSTSKYKSKKVRMLYDCTNETSAYMAIITYNNDGTVDTSNYNDYNSDVISIVPDTVGEVLFKAICKNR